MMCKSGDTEIYLTYLWTVTLLFKTQVRNMKTGLSAVNMESRVFHHSFGLQQFLRCLIK